RSRRLWRGVRVDRDLGRVAGTVGDRIVHPGRTWCGPERRLETGGGAWVGFWSTTTSSGPLKPGPKPVASRSYAFRVVVCAGFVPASAAPSVVDSAGIASVSKTPRDASTAAFGWPVTNRPKRTILLTSPAAGGSSRMTKGRRPRSTRCPILARIAGSSVTAVQTATTTVIAEPRPSFVTNGIPTRARPETEIATVVPAKITALPAVEPA